MENLILLVVCFLLGIGLRRTGRFPDNTPSAFNGFIVHVSLPALTLVYVHELRLAPELIYAASMPWVMFALGVAILAPAARLLKLSRASTGCLVLVGSLANTSFIGLPMIEAFYGASEMGTGVVIDQLGSYLALSTVGIIVASAYASGDGLSLARLGKKLIGFPPFVAMVLALLLNPFPYPEWLTELLKRLGLTLAPLALVSVGFQLRLSQVQGKALALGAGLLFKLAVGPALILLLYSWLVGLEGTTLQVIVFEAAMAPMIGASIIAMEHDLDPPLATLMVGVGIPLSFATLPLWHRVLAGF